MLLILITRYEYIFKKFHFFKLKYQAFLKKFLIFLLNSWSESKRKYQN